MIIRLDWAAPIVPGGSMAGLLLGTSQADVLSALDCCRIDEGIENVIQFDNSPKLLVDSWTPGLIVLSAYEMNDINYLWQNKALTVVFKDAKLASVIARGLPEQFRYQGGIYGCVGLGSPVSDLLPYCDIEYDSAEECFFPIAEDVGLAVAGSGSCDLSIDNEQKISFIHIF